MKLILFQVSNIFYQKNLTVFFDLTYTKMVCKYVYTFSFVHGFITINSHVSSTDMTLQY